MNPVFSLDDLLIYFKDLFIYIRDRERKSMFMCVHTHERGRERERTSQADSLLNMEPKTGLDL